MSKLIFRFFVFSFCPALNVIAQVLKLSQNIAVRNSFYFRFDKSFHLKTFIQGVTFLAFGNGAPDIFSAIAAVTSAKGGDVGLAFGALFGRKKHSFYIDHLSREKTIQVPVFSSQQLSLERSV